MFKVVIDMHIILKRLLKLWPNNLKTPLRITYIIPNIEIS